MAVVIRAAAVAATLALGFVTAMLVSVGTPSWAVAENDHDTCCACHGDRSKADPQSVFVDPEVLAASEHSDLNCADCHADAREKELASGQILPHPKNLLAVNCTSCHHSGNEQGAPDFSPMPQYRTSVHGRASIEMGDRDVATCSDCHGKHNIRAASDPDSTIYRTNIPRTCAVCHENMQMILKHNIHVEQPYSEYQQSVHGKAQFIDGVATMAAVCTDCHGAHDIQANGEANLRPHQPGSCGRCHLDEYMAYSKSIHGKAFKDNISDAPVCADCHGEHKIAAPWDPESSVSVLHVTETCAACHDDVAMMSKYSILTDKVSTFRNSDHGMGSALGIISVATCVSCHGYHDILPADDAESSIHRENLPKTCGKANCHPTLEPKILEAKIHINTENVDIKYLRRIRTLSLWSIGILFGLGALTGLVKVATRMRRNADRSSSSNGEGTKK